MKADNILATIGNTPHIRINRLFGAGQNVWIKSERANPGGSIKDRIALGMVEDAEKSGKLKPGGTIIEPTASPVISGGKHSPHPLQGIGAGFIPKNLDIALLDGTIQVEAEAAKEMARRAAREEGMLIGLSSGATLAAIAQKLPEVPKGARVIGFNYDTGERYLSVEGFLPA